MKSKGHDDRFLRLFDNAILVVLAKVGLDLFVSHPTNVRTIGNTLGENKI